MRNLILDRLRKEAEDCDCLQGFQFVHSIGGGTGSGMIAHLLKDIKNQFYNKITETYTVFPSNKYQDTVVEPYNAVLSLAQMKEYADIIHVIDNDALYNICSNHLRLSRPDDHDLKSINSISYIRSDLFL